jgi:hypothetical protein
MANGEKEQRKCHYCFQMFNKDEMLGDGCGSYACEQDYRSKVQETNKFDEFFGKTIGYTLLIMAITLATLSFVALVTAIWEK